MKESGVVYAQFHLAGLLCTLFATFFILFYHAWGKQNYSKNIYQIIHCLKLVNGLSTGEFLSPFAATK